MEKIPEFEATIILRNNRLKRRRTALGLTQQQMADAIGINKYAWSQYECLSRSPLITPWWEKRPYKNAVTDDDRQMFEETEGYEWKEDALRIADHFYTAPEELWPKLSRKVVRNRIIREVSAGEMEALLGDHTRLAALPPSTVSDNKALSDAVKEALSTLSPREVEVLTRRFGLGGGEEEDLDATGEDLPTDCVRPGDSMPGIQRAKVKETVSRERVRQIEAKALRALRHPSRSRLLRPFIEDTEHISRDRPSGVEPVCSACCCLAVHLDVCRKEVMVACGVDYWPQSGRKEMNVYESIFAVPTYYCAHPFSRVDLIRLPHEESCSWFRARPDGDCGVSELKLSYEFLRRAHVRKG